VLTISQQIFIICTYLLRHQFILTLSNLVSFQTVQFVGHSDVKFQVALVWKNDMWQVTFRKKKKPTNVYQYFPALLRNFRNSTTFFVCLTQWNNCY